MSGIQVGLPLLAKELTEQAARKRTYVFRFIYASFLFCMVLFSMMEMGYHWGSMGALGGGRHIFDAIMLAQLIGIYLLLPALTCGLLTQEKERSTLDLLLVTRLGSWTILAEKLLGRLIPMLMYLSLSLPVLAIAYALGGVSQTELWCGVWILVVSSFYVATLGLMCSAWLQTTTSSFIAIYIIGFSMVLGPLILDAMQVFDVTVRMASLFFPFEILDRLQRLGISEVFNWSLPSTIASILFLLIARVGLVRQERTESGNLIRILFRSIDRVWLRLGKLMKQEDGGQQDLPTDRPIEWRECTRGVTGSLRHQCYMCIGITVLIVWILGTINDQATSIVILIFAALVFLLVCVRSASLFTSERSRQTLDVLMTVPICNRELLEQKMASIYRLLLLCIFPFVVILWFALPSRPPYADSSTGFYVFSTIATLSIYLPMVTWLCVIIGLKIRNQTRAVFGSIIAIVGWCLLPIFGLFVFVYLFDISDRSVEGLLIVSPLTFLVANEIGLEANHFVMDSHVMLVLNSMIYLVILSGLRRFCLNNLDMLLDRTDDGTRRLMNSTGTHQ